MKPISLVKLTAVAGLAVLAAWTTDDARWQSALRASPEVSAIHGYDVTAPARCKDVDIVTCGSDDSEVCPSTDCNVKLNQWVLLGMPCAKPDDPGTPKHCTWNGLPNADCGSVLIFRLCRLTGG